MPQLYIPRLGDSLTLTEPWTFDVYREYRNETLLHYLESTGVSIPDKTHWETLKVATHTFPSGTVLTVDRIYIRSGGEDYDSVTFRVKGFEATKKTWNGKIQKVKTLRFWAKLKDVNTMVIA